MHYDYNSIEKKWQAHWNETGSYRVSNLSEKPKYYVLDMFPYPSGAGLHVGHPLGYIASDIFSRYKRLKGYNVLHPMGYDAFGLPAEQYAIEHGVHPADSTAKNIANFRAQLDKIGFCYDWSREVNTSQPDYYRWTQWIFLQLFKSFYNRQTQKAEPITVLEEVFGREGNTGHPFPNDKYTLPNGERIFSAAEWLAWDEPTRMGILMEYRLAYCGYGEVNWCEALGTVLANDEVVNGVSERGGHPVVKKKLRQWYLRITEYADRLQSSLDTLDWSDAMKEMQTNWIGKSYGAEIEFGLTPSPSPGGEGGKSSFRTAAIEYWKYLKEFGRENRKHQTEAEDLVWQAVRNNQLGSKVRRQHTVLDYIIDFAFLNEKLLVEIDGGYHQKPEQAEYDAFRTAELATKGYTVIRFSNDEVINNLPDVISTIKTALAASKQNLPQTEAPLSTGRGAGGEATTPSLKVYTTRPDTIFGVDFMVIAPEHALVDQITTDEQRAAVEEYVAYVNSRSERERQAEKKITGCFTGAYAINPFDGREIPIWISEYVLAGYGTGAIMAVPCGDERDHKFAQHFGIPITNIIGQHYNGEEANPTKDAVLENSGFLNGVPMREASEIVINKLEEMGLGQRKVNYKMRDAAFSRQRYWGEPFPIVWKNGVAYPLDESELPLQLPHVDSYGPGPEGEGPLANIDHWTARDLETNTMPGYAGSSWYFLRYMDPHNDQAFAGRAATDYWNQVDLYVGGTEHAVGHLLYSRMWTKALYDLGYIGFDEPFRKLLNQGMIQGSSRFVYRLHGTNTFVSKSLLDENDQYNGQPTNKLHVDVNMVDGYELDTTAFVQWRNGEHAGAEFIFEDGTTSSPLGGGREGAGIYLCGSEVEKMSKSKFNTVNPDDLVEKYGADTFRMYEMFLGPVEISKPWDTKGIEGVHRFLKKLWRLFYDEQKGWLVNNDTPTADELKTLHRTIKKIEDDTERFSFNTAVSAFMVGVNELTDLKCHKAAILEPLIVMLTPYAPHIAAELYDKLQPGQSVLDAPWPAFDARHVVESSKEYPVSINGKLRTTMHLPLDAEQATIEAAVLANEVVQKWMDGKAMKKFIFVKGKMINVVV